MDAAVDPAVARLAERLRKDGEICLNSPIELMRFTLIYDGPLPAPTSHNGRCDDKHRIRTAFHKQLAELWSEREPLQRAWNFYRKFGPEALKEEVHPYTMNTDQKLPPWMQEAQRFTRVMQADYLRKAHGILIEMPRGPFKFVPLATKAFDLVCELDILFLRAEPPGRLFTNNAGDLDNRIKVLLDALRVPAPNELPPTAAPSDSQTPFFCLMEDDKLVTAIRLESERLLDEPEESNRVHLVVHVTMKTRRVTLVTLDIEGD